MKSARSLFVGLTLLVPVALGALPADPTPAPAGPWRQFAAPEKAGWSLEKLAEARAFAEKVGSAAVMAVHDGTVVVAWGDVARRLELHSVRKSLVSALAGLAVADGKLDPDKTLAELGIDDIPPLTADEKRAKVIDLLRSRSGIYHAAAKETSDVKKNRPARGSAGPGETWLYNNWDFNMVGVILELVTGRRLFDEFERRIAAPLHMEDFRLRDGYEQFERTLSKHPAHAFRMSARDLARFGWMYAQHGFWDGKPVVPREWIDESTRVHSEVRPGTGYGLMWWVYPKGGLADYPALNACDKFAAIGSNGQLVLVVPATRFVYVHLADSDHERSVGGRDVWRLAEMILAARVEAGEGKPETRALEPAPFANAAPPLPEYDEIELGRDALSAFVGAYGVRPGLDIEIKLSGDRLIAAMTGYPEVDIFPDTPVTYFAKAVPVRIRFERDASGQVSGLVVTMPGGRDLAARRKI